MTETENEAEETVEFHMKGKVMREVIDAFMGVGTVSLGRFPGFGRSSF